MMAGLARGLVVTLGLLVLWQVVVWATGVPRYLLPEPLAVFRALWLQWPLILHHALLTLAEIVLGLVLGLILGALMALILSSSAVLNRWLLPVVIASQAVPVFALAPLLVLWLGYGMASKVAMAVLVIFFPVTASFHDGLRRVERGWIEQARVMDAGAASILWQIRLPAALPAFGAGARIAAVVAPIGAVIGEWVGSAGGLGYLMLHANGRMQTDLLFAALLVLCLMAMALWLLVDRLLRRLIFWQPDTLHAA